LYRQLNKNSLSSIKAMHCEHCKRIVDPYIEREWLLVVIDCTLLRPEAYRHILYNHHDFSWHVHAQKTKTGKQQQDEKAIPNSASTAAASTPLVQRLIQWTLVSSLFHAYLKYQTLIQTQHQLVTLRMFSDADSSTLLYATFFGTSVLDLAVQWFAIYGFMRLLPAPSNGKAIDSERTESAKPSPPPPSHSMAYQIYLAMLLPTSFQVVSILVLLWENSKTTRALGSLLVACWQSLGISLISIRSSSSSKPSSKSSSVLKACAPLVGIVALIAWRFGVGQFLRFVAETAGNNGLKYLHHTIPCVGFEIDAFGHAVNGFAFEHSGGWVSPPLLLCLT
jgi:hypothetical protein